MGVGSGLAPGANNLNLCICIRESESAMELVMPGMWQINYNGLPRRTRRELDTSVLSCATSHTPVLGRWLGCHNGIEGVYPSTEGPRLHMP